MTEFSSKLRIMIISALFAAIIGILAQITIPLPLVPITGQTLAIGLAATILGSRYGTLSVLVYILMGAVGLPVYAQMSGGLGILFGPTGGFLFAFIPAAFVIGYYLERNKYTIRHAVIANIIGMFISLSVGTIWLKLIAHLTWPAAFLTGFLPFIIVGVLKAILAAVVGVKIRQRLLGHQLVTIWTHNAKN